MPSDEFDIMWSPAGAELGAVPLEALEVLKQIFFGPDQVAAFFFGLNPVAKVYLGDILVWAS
jgi:hypothetical protein